MQEVKNLWAKRCFIAGREGSLLLRESETLSAGKMSVLLGPTRRDNGKVTGFGGS